MPNHQSGMPRKSCVFFLCQSSKKVAGFPPNTVVSEPMLGQFHRDESLSVPIDVPRFTMLHSFFQDRGKNVPEISISARRLVLTIIDLTSQTYVVRMYFFVVLCNGARPSRFITRDTSNTAICSWMPATWWSNYCFKDRAWKHLDALGKTRQPQQIGFASC